MRSILKFVRASPLGVCAINIAFNQRERFRQFRGAVASDGGARHGKMSLDQSIAYIDEVYDDYRAQIDGEFHGRIAEVGPGDTCGVALRLIEGGAQTVHLIDRFYSRRDPGQLDFIHRRVIESSPRLGGLFPANATVEDGERIVRFYGPDAAAEYFFDTHRPYDFIVSRAVLEHLQDVPRSLTGMASALAPGGCMVHVVDLRDHGMFSNYGHHELRFLDVPGPVYRAMTDACGHPNRTPLGVYRDTLDQTGLSFEIKVSRLVGERDQHEPVAWGALDAKRRDAALRIVAQRKPGFAPELRRQPDADLAVSGFTIVARRG